MLRPSSLLDSAQYFGPSRQILMTHSMGGTSKFGTMVAFMETT
jgi:hypothetical protein